MAHARHRSAAARLNSIRYRSNHYFQLRRRNRLSNLRLPRRLLLGLGLDMHDINLHSSKLSINVSVGPNLCVGLGCVGMLRPWEHEFCSAVLVAVRPKRV